MSEHTPQLELREVRVLRHRFDMSQELEGAVRAFFEPTQKAIRFGGFFATRELVLDGFEYHQERYHEFLRHNQHDFERRKRAAILLGRHAQTGAAIQFAEKMVGARPHTQIALRPLDQAYLNEVVESMNTFLLDADPYIAPYQDIRPTNGQHYFRMDVTGGTLVPPSERKTLIQRFSFEATSHERKRLFYLRPDMITTSSETRRVIPHPTRDVRLEGLILDHFDTNDVA